MHRPLLRLAVLLLPLGVVAGARELPVGHRVPFTLIFVRHNRTCDCTIFHCMHQRRNYLAVEIE